MFYLVCGSPDIRTNLIEFLKRNGIQSVFHYQPLHDSPYYRDRYTGEELTNAVRYANCLVRLPFFYELAPESQDEIVRLITEFCHASNNHSNTSSVEIINV